MKCTCCFWWLISPKSVFLVVGDKSKISGCIQLVFLVIFVLAVSACYRRVISGELWVCRSTGGRVSQRAAKQICSFPYQQRESSWSFQSKWSLLNEKVFLSLKPLFFMHLQSTRLIPSNFSRLSFHFLGGILIRSCLLKYCSIQVILLNMILFQVSESHNSWLFDQLNLLPSNAF